MKLMTYNILGGWQDRIHVITNIIAEESPDYLVLNEANSLVPDVYGHLKKLTSTTGLSYAAAAPSGEDTYHVLMLAKKPFQYVQFLTPLVRAGLLAVVSSEFGKIAIVGTHLTPTSETERMIETKLILKAVEPFENVIILGDLNALSPQDDYSHLTYEELNHIQRTKFTVSKKLRFDVVSALLERGFADAAVKTKKLTEFTTPTAITDDAAHSKMRLDYVFVSSRLASAIKNYYVVKNKDTEVASDHYPVVVELKRLDDSIEEEREKIIEKNWFGFKWDSEKVWNLDLPVEEMEVANLSWHLDIPLWEYQGKKNSLTPRQVLQDPEINPDHFQRIIHSNLDCPIDIMWWNEKWMMLDGVHRLAKTVHQQRPTIRVRKVPQELIPEIRIPHMDNA